jgi:hypothetical protein
MILLIVWKLQQVQINDPDILLNFNCDNETNTDPHKSSESEATDRSEDEKKKRYEVQT